MTNTTDVYTKNDIVKLMRKWSVIPIVSKYERDIFIGAQYIYIFFVLLLIVNMLAFNDNQIIAGFAFGGQTSILILELGYIIFAFRRNKQFRKENKIIDRGITELL